MINGSVCDTHIIKAGPALKIFSSTNGAGKAIGKLFGAVVCMIGVLMVALPTGILASGFLEEMREQRRGRDQDIFGYCPHCGKQLIPGEELE